MKNKFFKRPQDEEQKPEETEEEIIEQKAQEEDDNTEIDSGGPGIASVKRNKLLLVAASSFFITAVIYFIFFKGSDAPQANLEPVAPIIRPTDVARSETGKSPFEINQIVEKTSEDLALLEKPKTPDIPKLPELSAEEKKEGLLSLDDLAKKEQLKQLDPLAVDQLPILPIAPLPTDNKPLQGQAQLQAPPMALGQAPAGTKIDPSYSDPKYAPIVVMSGGAQSGAGSVGVGYDKNIIVLNGDPIRSLEKSTVTVKTTFVDNRQNVVAQGKLLTAVLETAINTELPGFVRAIVSRDVYGEAGNEVLISRGSRLFGSYSSEVVRGQGRVQINWTRLIRPDGIDLALSSSASDQFGRAGLQGDVDNRYGSIIAGSLL